MCAIGGFFGPATPADATNALSKIMATMRHRGPDDAGIFVDAEAQVALAHNRLSIIDLSPGGHQPMIDADSGDTLVFNGEIYNFRDIREELKHAGVVFQSQSDTEVLLKAFGRWGLGCLQRLKGMFAFAIWRPQEATLYVVRDPAGVKPIYYRETEGGGLVFASEIKAFAQLPAFGLQTDPVSVGEFLEFGYTFEETRTIFHGISKLAPGEMIICRRGSRPRIERHFSLSVQTRAATSAEDLAAELYRTLDAVVAQQLVADVPVGILLSGGIDSSIVAALAARKTTVTSITMGFSGSAVDERTEARQTATFIGAQHEDIVISPHELTVDIGAIAATFDDVFADWGTLSTRLLYKKARERGIKVVLTGEGSDEIFGGYPIFRMSASRAPTELWLFQIYRMYAGRRYGSHYGAFRRLMRGYLRGSGGDRFDALRLFETRNQLPNNYVQKVDKASMSVSVEARVPFLDQRVLELAFRIPERFLLTRDREKVLLRQMARREGLLPEDVLNRPKFGASVAASWMDEQAGFRDFARDVILSGEWAAALGLRRSMEDYFLRSRGGDPFPRAISIFRNLAWRVLLLELWSSAMGVRANAG